MIKVIKSIEWIGYCVWGISLFEYIALKSVGKISGYFPNIDADLVTIATVLGLLVIVLNAGIRLDKHIMQRKVEAENLQKIKNENIKAENENYAFRSAIDAIPKEEFKNSADRLK